MLLPKRKRLRLPEHDYSSGGYYFVTVCVNGGASLFGEIKSGVMCLSNAGKMVEMVWKQMPEYYAGVGIDEFVVMPNHIHGIIQLHVVAGPRAGQKSRPRAGQGVDIGRPQGAARTSEGSWLSEGVICTSEALSLSDVMHRFKSMTTALYRHGVKANGWAPFAGRLWLRSYYDRLIYNAAELIQAREYIGSNPSQWSIDDENPERKI